ncbi:Secreted effector protein pipB2 [Posidoniimonas corsicana]|uniref:Secreted effector protein pipB2 n=1 Tax=Posidoniimonas corsicana TaxID=1938618 RepID=A0A5C5VFA3_9BACT|nr:pentapeptide repeat-containing protein [Posidoniimonas corsicana]TWT37326.1 Secreted effector protein pipB2 [Posidoniimonas corsicana]
MKRTLLCALLPLAGLSAGWPTLRADIYQWEYINPANPSEGKQPSATLAPQGAGVDAAPRAFLDRRDLTKAYLIGADLTNAYVYRANLTNADLSGANLTDASMASVTFTGAVLAQAEIRESVLADVTSRGFTPAQLYSTASYQNQDLSGIIFDGNDFTGWDFSSQNLSRTRYYSATLTGADFTGVVLRDANLHRATQGGFSAAQLYSSASHQNQDLRGVLLSNCDLTGWDLAGQDLTGASFLSATLLNVDLNGATIEDVTFYNVTSEGFTSDQLYSTASYQSGSLRGVNLGYNDLAGWDFAGQDLTGVNLSASELAGASLAGAEVANAWFQNSTSRGFTVDQLYSTASYQAKSLPGVKLYGNDMAGWDFAGFNLEGASFGGGSLVDTDFTDADIRNATFGQATYSGWTAEQLYSTASYQAGDLRGVSLLINDLIGWDFEGQNLLGANLSANLEGASFRHAYLANAEMNASGIDNTHLADFTGADARGAQAYFGDAATTDNMIYPDGSVAGLDLTLENRWIVRDYDGYDNGYDPPDPPLAIRVEEGFTTAPESVIEVLFESDAWDSIIFFEAGIAVTLDGVLDLAFTVDVDLADQVGRTFRLFDWTGVAPSGAFTVESEHSWDLTGLYTTGEVTLLGVGGGLPGDFNNDGVVDAADYTVWRDQVGAPAGTLPNDPTGAPVGPEQYATWRANFGQSAAQPAATAAPEPAALLALLVCLARMPRRCRVPVD